MKKFDLKKAILENKATFFSSLTEGYDEFQRADKGSKDVTAKNKGEEEVYGAGVKKGEEIEMKKMKMSELKGKIKKMVMAEMALDIDTMENAPESEVNFYEGLESMLGEENEFDMNKPARIKEFITALNRLVDEYHSELYLNDNLFAAIEMVIKAAKDEIGLNEASIKEADSAVIKAIGDKIQKDPEFLKKTKDAMVKAEKGDTSDLAMMMAGFGKMFEAKEEKTEEEEIEVTDEFSGEEEGEGGISVSQNADADLTGNKKQVQDNLEAALEAAKTLGDDKLATQIGNSLTFFTKQHVVK